MAIDPSRLDAFLSDPNVPEADKRAVADQLRSAVPEPLTGPSAFAGSTPTSTAQDRALSYLTKRGGEIAGAVGRVARDVAEFPSSSPDRTWGGRASDVATVAGTALAPVATGVGALAGTAARAAGASEDVATGVDIAGTLGTGVLSALHGAYRGVTDAPAIARAAAKAQYASVGEAAKNLTMSPAQASQLGDELLAATKWGGTRPMEAKAVQPLLDKLTLPGGSPLTYADLDSAYAGLQRIRGPSYMRGILDDHIKTFLMGSKAADARSAAKAAWQASKAKTTRGFVPFAPAMTGFGAAAYDLKQGQPLQAAEDVALGLAGAWGLRNLTTRGLGYAARGALRGGGGAALSAGARIPGLLDAETSSTPRRLPQPPAEGPPEKTATVVPGEKARVRAGSLRLGPSKAFAANLETLVEVAKEAGHDVSIQGGQGGYRSPEQQAILWRQALQKYGSAAAARKWVAPPGGSAHQKGIAADLTFGSDKARAFVHRVAPLLGLQFRMGNEPWHIEIGGYRPHRASR